MAEPKVVEGAEPLWFLGTLAHVLLDGDDTGGRFSATELTLPQGAAPPLHSHPQDETFYVLDGELTVWLLGAGPPQDESWFADGRRCPRGGMLFAPAGTPHSFRVETDTARVLALSTPAGIERMFRGLGEPALWPWLQPPPDGPRVPAERIAAVEQEIGMVRHGPPPPPA